VLRGTHYVLLDVGSGTGYLTACMALMSTDGTSKVYGVEHIKELVDSSINNIAKGNKDLLDAGRVEILCADGRDGLVKEAPFDAIHVGAASPHVPKQLLDQLAPGGRLVIPIGDEGATQRLMCYDKDANTGKISEEVQLFVSYVPLTDADYQLHKSYGGTSE
jgi:protein-L-isoaspartate(D-aspartate) O-methyltransferase